MDFAQTFAISAAGMSVQRMRVEVAALNLANAHSVQGPGAPAYQPLRVLVAPSVPFESMVDTGLQTGALPVATVEATVAAPRMVHDPGHPLADARGFVHQANVDPATEIVTLMSAMRSYEANVAALNSARSLALKTLEIGRGS
ncbi:flagellar basal body rod protein FlgC [Ramlibacter alkalitolerans]|uniref:Flagellar basal-body rod protein FlgC n=1 Tax=Ramlibacter alkalitolerans TaxID=2039631 RepID=A0ABS1JUZ9_9BURK|nr:flagellar basal body rod protein FlgC [Ramlibacter alkalitolerans]MBL0427395.1 flagellar basal body rod protein FlgC [Ramlibacter alkalitolerans]